MKSHLNNFRDLSKSKIIILLVLIIIIIPFVFKLLRVGFFSMYDDMQVVRLWQMDKCFKDLQIPCRWVPDLGLGYGYPLFLYYAPLSYYVMEMIHLLGFSLINAVKFGFIISVFFSGLFFYLLARTYFSKIASLFTSFLYIYAPYRAASIYVRGSMGEAWGFAAIPFVFWGFENYLKKRSIRSGLLFSISLAFISVSHNLTFLMVIPVLVAWILLRIYLEKINAKNIKRIIFYALIGFGLASFYLVPLLFERNLVHLETLTSGYFGYRQHFINLKQIFVSLKWGYGPSVMGPNDDVFLGIGPIHSILVLGGLVAVAFAFRKNRKRFMQGLFLFGVFLFSAFLSHQKSSFIWENIKFMEIFQFPWRFIAISIFCASLLSGFLIDIWDERIKIYIVFLCIFVTMLMYDSFYKPKDWFVISDYEKLEGVSLKKQLTASIYDYLPKGAKRAPDDIANSDLVIINGFVDTRTKNKGSDWFEYKVNVVSENAEVAIPAYSFPNWKVKVNNNIVPAKPQGDFGLIGLTLNKGEEIISAKLTKSAPRKIGDLISVVCLFVFFVIYNEKSFRKIVKK